MTEESVEHSNKPRYRTETVSVVLGSNPEGKKIFGKKKVKVLVSGEPPPPDGPFPLSEKTGEEASILQTKLPEPKSGIKGN